MAKKVRISAKKNQRAIEAIKKHRLRERLEEANDDEAHRILPEIWPIIQELLVLTDACETGRLRITA